MVGVDIRKETIAAGLAPSFFKDIVAGKTPQEHNGKGIPKREALITEKKLFSPKCLDMVSVLMKTCKIPAKKKPKSRNGDISFNKKTDSFMIPIIIFIIERFTFCRF